MRLVSMKQRTASLPGDLQRVGGGRSGERPLGDVLLRQVVVQVSSQSADGHRRHVTGAAV